MTISNGCRVSNSSQKLRGCGLVFARTATAHCMNYVGIIQRSGDSYQRRPILFPLFRRGRNSWKGVSSIASLLMSKPQAPRSKEQYQADSSRNEVRLILAFRREQKRYRRAASVGALKRKWRLTCGS